MATDPGERKLWLVGWLIVFFWVYGISTFVGYLQPHSIFIQISSITNNSV